MPIKNKKTAQNVNPPKSYDRMLKDIDPELYDKVKRLRKSNGKSAELLLDRQSNLTREERRKIAEARMKQVVKDIRKEV